MPLKNLGQPPFIEKPLKGLKNSVSQCKGRQKKGDELEKNWSKIIHAKGIPVLVSSQLLRSFQCGQIDLANYSQGKLMVYEIKSCPEALNPKQILRLNKSIDLISKVLDRQACLKVLNHLPK